MPRRGRWPPRSLACHAVFHPGRDRWASGKSKAAFTLSAGAVGGLACAHRRWAPRREGSAPPGGGRWPFPGRSLGIKPLTPPVVVVCLGNASPPVPQWVAGTAVCDLQIPLIFDVGQCKEKQKRRQLTLLFPSPALHPSTSKKTGFHLIFAVYSLCAGVQESTRNCRMFH